MTDCEPSIREFHCQSLCMSVGNCRKRGWPGFTRMPIVAGSDSNQIGLQNTGLKEPLRVFSVRRPDGNRITLFPCASAFFASLPHALLTNTSFPGKAAGTEG